MNTHISTWTVSIVFAAVLVTLGTTASAESRFNHEETYFIHRIFAGVGVSFGEQTESNAELDGTVGASFIWNDAANFIELIPEAGYHRIFDKAGDDHYAMIGVRFQYSQPSLGGGVHSYYLVGSADGELSQGIRTGLHINILMGILGLDVSHQWTTEDRSEGQHSIRIVAFLDWVRIFQL